MAASNVPWADGMAIRLTWPRQSPDAILELSHTNLVDWTQDASSVLQRPIVLEDARGRVLGVSQDEQNLFPGCSTCRAVSFLAFSRTTDGSRDAI